VLNKKIVLCLAGSALTLTSFAGVAGDTPSGAVKFTPADLKWSPSTRVPGLQKAEMTGDDHKTGPYMYRIKFPAGFRMQAHAHPDSRSYTVISGTWYIGWGDKFDESKLIALPAGSFYTEPSSAPHFVATRGEVEIQITGWGPTAVNYVDAKHAKK